MALFVHLGDAGKQLFVELDGVEVRGELWAVFGVELRHELGGVAGAERPEGVADAVQQLAGALERSDGVLESGRFGGGSDRGNFGAVLLEPGVERGAEVFVADLGELRQFVWQRGWCCKRVR